MTEPSKRGRRPGRPRDERNSERRRSELVAAAYRVFTTKGYALATAADIAAEVGVGYGTFYNYFDSKRAILDDVLDYGIDRFFTEVASEILEPDVGGSELSLDAVLRIWSDAVDRMCRIAEDEPSLFRVLLFESTGIDDELDSRLLGLSGLTASAISRFLDRAVEAGALRRDLDTTELAWVLLALTMPPLLRTIQGFGPQQRRRYRETVRAVLEPGLRTCSNDELTGEDG
ncbi:TetR/AcrR family transcriptional regulator [Nocardia nova]|uniref:TetR/AcrR family transcriptional regulator n=1 Tax=Nocardia nova TaxID=37330 RepID=UPI00046CAF1E|nr:TetR/AcrR family transcriptional regulator [Nocardia nova]